MLTSEFLKNAYMWIHCNCRAKFGIEEMCRDQWNWASKNPYGYLTKEEAKESKIQTVHVLRRLLFVYYEACTREQLEKVINEGSSEVALGLVL